VPVSFHSLRPGDEYTRHDLAKAWGYAGIEAISRGVVTPAGDNKIILFVTKRKRPEDIQYRDELVGNVLLWEGPNDHFAEDRMINHVERGDQIHVFYREEHRDAFTYVGPMTLYCGQRFADRPSRFVFQTAAVGAVRAA
jgi:putative restriction endonuclease